MANWYVSSVAYTAIAAFATTTAYVIGNIVRPTAAASGRKQAYRCTTAGTTAGSEPTWGSAFGGTTVSGTATFTAINGDTYGWTGAAGDLGTVINTSTTGYGDRGDTFFVASNHSESVSSVAFGNGFATGTWTTTTTHVLCVNPAGSVPPVAADVTTGASITATSSLTFNAVGANRLQGVTFINSGGGYTIGNGGTSDSYYFKNCSLQISSVTSSLRFNNTSAKKIVFDNTSVSFANAGQSLQFDCSTDLTWINTASPLLGTAPTSLFISRAGDVASVLITCRGVDFSAYTGILFNSSSTGNPVKLLLDSCKVSASATLYGGTAGTAMSVVELVNCWDGSNVLNTHVTAAGTVATERTIVLSGGATDDIGAFSLSLVTTASHLDKYVDPLDTFWFDVQNSSTGVSKTATVEIVSSAALNNDEIWLELEYMGASGTPLATITNSLPATVLTTAAAVTTSTATWSSSPATPAYQKLQVTFTPQRAGRVRGRVLCGKPSKTVYVNPVITIT